MIVYNGSSGSLGRYMATALERRSLGGRALAARLEDRASLRDELAGLGREGDPTLIQLAARVSVPACQADPEGTFRINVEATLATVQDFVSWAHGSALTPRVVYVSTGHVYAEQSSGTRLGEDAPTAPRSVYATSKLRAEEGLTELATDLGFDLTIARVFGLLAPRQPANYLLPGLIARVRENRLADVPGLSYVRDYLDARDVCDALLLLAALERGPAGTGVFNVCSGAGVTISEILATIIRMAEPGRTDDLMARVSEAPGRPDDITSIVGDPSRYIDLTGRLPRTIALATTIGDALADG